MDNVEIIARGVPMDSTLVEWIRDRGARHPALKIRLILRGMRGWPRPETYVEAHVATTLASTRRRGQTPLEAIYAAFNRLDEKLGAGDMGPASSIAGAPQGPASGSPPAMDDAPEVGRVASVPAPATDFPPSGFPPEDPVAPLVTPAPPKKKESVRPVRQIVAAQVVAAHQVPFQAIPSDAQPGGAPDGPAGHAPAASAVPEASGVVASGTKTAPGPTAPPPSPPVGPKKPVERIEPAATIIIR